MRVYKRESRKFAVTEHKQRMGRRSVAHLSGARNLGHPIERRQQKHRGPTEKENFPPVSVLPVGVERCEIVFLD